MIVRAFSYKGQVCRTMYPRGTPGAMVTAADEAAKARGGAEKEVAVSRLRSVPAPRAG